MEQPIRMLHFADTHIGVENYGQLDPATGTSSRVRDFLDRLDEMIEYALGQDVDLAVFAGDAFKNRSPKPTLQREFAHRIRRLSERMPVLLLVGNHDMPAMEAKASSLDIYDSLAVPNVVVGERPEGRIFETKRGPVYLAWMPYPLRNRLLSQPEHEAKSISELEVALRKAVAETLVLLARQAAAYDMPRVLVGHLSVAEGTFGSEQSVMLGRDVAVSSEQLSDSVWDYIALGHLHRHQQLGNENGPPIVYSGSLSRIDFGEEKEAKGFCMVELAKGAASWRFVPVAARPFRTIQIDLKASQDPTRTALDALETADCEGAVVRIILDINDSQIGILREREIAAALKAAQSVRVEKRITRASRARLDGSPETWTPLELIKSYFKLQGVEPNKLADLLEKAKGLIRDSD